MKAILYFVAGFFAFLLSSCASTSIVSGTNNNMAKNKLDPQELQYMESGVASYYSERFVGRVTANGEIYDSKLLTAAHPSLPFDSLLLVKRRSNGRYVIVRINDRGPFFQGRNLDLSRTAAKKLGILTCGITLVDVFLIPKSSKLAALL